MFLTPCKPLVTNAFATQSPLVISPHLYTRGSSFPVPQDATISTLATDVAAKLQALRGLKGKLGEVQDYLAAVVAGKLPLNHDINGYLQVGGPLLGLR